MNYSGTVDVTLQNLPYFKWEVGDNAVSNGQIEVEMLTLTYEFLQNGQTLATGPVGKPVPSLSSVEFAVPVAIPFFSSAKNASEFDFSSDNLPDTIRVTAMDPAGNVRQLTHEFALKIVPPPLCVAQATKAANAADLDIYPMKERETHLRFAPGASNTRVSHLSVTNPYPFPVRVLLGNVSSLVKLETTRFANARTVGADNGCVHKQADPVCVTSFSAACTPWSALSSATHHTRGVDGALVLQTYAKKDFVILGEAVGPDGAWTIPGGAVRYLNVMAQLGGTCLVPAPTQVGSSIYYPEPASVSCGQTTTAPTATCRYDFGGLDWVDFWVPRYIQTLSASPHIALVRSGVGSLTLSPLPAISPPALNMTDSTDYFSF